MSDEMLALLITIVVVAGIALWVPVCHLVNRTCSSTAKRLPNPVHESEAKPAMESKEAPSQNSI